MFFFKHKMLMILETTSPEELILWSTYESINKAMKADFLQVLPEIEHREEDHNRDGKKDKLEMSISIPLSGQDVVSVKIVLVFDYKLYIYSDFQMESAAYIYHSSSLPGAEFNVIGDLTLLQREPLKPSGTDFRYNISVIKGSNTAQPPTNLEDIFLEYAKRNITTVFKNSYPVWKTGLAENESFKINIVIHYPIETVLYKVGFWQLLKWALVQYMAVYIIISFVMHRSKEYVFKTHLLSTLIINPMKQNV